ncbi:MAG: CdaR family protein [Acidobacteriota bacterium]
MKSVSSRLRRLWHTVSNYRIENAGLKLLAVILASLLFAISRQPVSDVRLVGVQLEYRGLAQGLEISGGDVNQTVSVRLRGPRDVVRNIMPNQVAVVADLSNKEPGDRVIQLKATDVSTPEGIEVRQVDPGTIRLRIEPTTRKRVKVEPDVAGQVRDGYELYSVIVEPQTVEIQGPESQVAEVESVSTESVQLVERTTPFRVAVDVDHPNHAIRVVTPGPIALSFDIGEIRKSRRIDLPVRWMDQSGAGKLLTVTVNVELFGPRSLVESIVPDQIRVELRTGSRVEGDHSAVPKVVLPVEGKGRIEVRSMTPAEVKYRL